MQECIDAGIYDAGNISNSGSRMRMKHFRARSVSIATCRRAQAFAGCEATAGATCGHARILGPMDDCSVVILATSGLDVKIAGSRSSVTCSTQAGILQNRCDWCGLTSWRGRPIAIQIDHINGVNGIDHRLENLRMLCPNCHSQTDTFAAKIEIEKRFPVRQAVRQSALTLIIGGSNPSLGA